MFLPTITRSRFVKQLAALILQLCVVKLQQDDIINIEIVKPTSHGKEYEILQQATAPAFVLHVNLMSLMASSVRADWMFPSSASFSLFSAEESSMSI